LLERQLVKSPLRLWKGFSSLAKQGTLIVEKVIQAAVKTSPFLQASTLTKLPIARQEK
jgi:hypothetical protein